MTSATRRRPATRAIPFDRALEALPLFRLSDSSDDAAISYAAEGGARWRVIPLVGDRLPGTFDQDVYFEIFRRFHDADSPSDGTIAFTLHNFLRSMGRRVDGRTYEQLRSALHRMQRTTLESSDIYWDAIHQQLSQSRFSLLSSIKIDRRRTADREQLGLFPVLAANEPGDARVTIASSIRANIGAGYTTYLRPASWLSLASPVSRRLYRMLAVVQAEHRDEWSLPLAALAEQLPLAQRYPSHLQRVLQPAHEMLVAAGVVRRAEVVQQKGAWNVQYVLARSAP